jgi:uncharacterized membrane protein YedE/YeeE
MLALGLILLIAAGGISVDIVLKNAASMDVSAFGQTISTTQGGLFVAGVVAGMVGVLGALMLTGGLARAGQRRAASRDLEKNLEETHGSTAQLKAERDRLAAEVQGHRARQAETIDLTDRPQGAATDLKENGVEASRVTRR